MSEEELLKILQGSNQQKNQLNSSSSELEENYFSSLPQTLQREARKNDIIGILELDNEPMVQRVCELLRGGRYNNQTRSWDYEEKRRLLKEKGIDLVHSSFSGLTSMNIIMSHMNDREIKDLLRTIILDLLEDLFAGDYFIEQKDVMASVFAIIEPNIFATFNRSRGGGERRYRQETVTTSQNFHPQHHRPQTKMSWNPFRKNVNNGDLV